jgi:FtsH-binding integral membrane protein
VSDQKPAARNRPVRDRDVIVTAAVVIAAVLIIARVTGFVPALDDVIGLEPVVIVGLIVVTIAVLVVALRPRRS